VARQAVEDGVHEKIVEAARRSPVYPFVKVWKLALPHHPEWRTLPMLFYVPPLLPIAASVAGGASDVLGSSFSSLEHARLPIRYMAALLSAGNEEPVEAAYRKMIAVRLYYRARTVGDVSDDDVDRSMATAGTTAAEIEAIYHLTSIAPVEERFVVPPFLRETVIRGGETPPEPPLAGEGFLRRAGREF
jgi:nitrate reductase beta subunit